MAIDFCITKKFGKISERVGWNREVNLVGWNGRAPKLDIRDWTEDGSKMGRGINMTRVEAEKLKEILNALDFDELDPQ